MFIKIILSAILCVFSFFSYAESTKDIDVIQVKLMNASRNNIYVNDKKINMGQASELSLENDGTTKWLDVKVGNNKTADICKYSIKGCTGKLKCGGIFFSSNDPLKCAIGINGQKAFLGTIYNNNNPYDQTCSCDIENNTKPPAHCVCQDASASVELPTTQE